MGSALHHLCPPFLKKQLKGLFGNVRWHGDYPDWESAAKICTGYDDPSIAQNVLKKTLAVLNGKAAFERDGVLFSKIQYNWPALACILSTAAKNSDPVGVLDFGGSLGSFFHQHRRFLAGDEKYQWHVVEQQHFVETGKAYVQVPHLHFHFTIEEALRNERPTVAFFSSVLQYLPDPWTIVDAVSSDPFKFLLIDRTPFTTRPGDRISRQVVSSKICRSQYPCRFFSENAFLNRLHDKWELVAQWEDLIDPCNLSGCEFFGMFFKRRDV